MLLTAQRVAALNGQEGINANLYDHPSLTTVDTTQLIEEIKSNAKKIIAAHHEIRPGNNDVLAYLEIAADDALAINALIHARDTVRPQVEHNIDLRPSHTLVSGVAVHFGATLGRYRNGKFLSDYDELWRYALIVLDRKPRPPWITGKPIEIVTYRGGGHAWFELIPESVQQLRLHHGPRWKPVRFSYDLDDAEDIASALGDLRPSIVNAITDLSLSELASIGGVLIRLRDSPWTVFWSWPR